MFIASVNTDVNLTNSRRICEHIHKEALVICNIDKRDNPAELIDNYVEKNWTYNRGKQKPQFEVGHTMQWQRDYGRQNTTRKTTDSAACKLMFSGRVSCSSSASGISRVSHVQKPMMNHERGKVLRIQMKYISDHLTLIYSAKVNSSSIQSFLLLK